MTHASAWRDLEDITISDSGQSPDQCCKSPFTSSWSDQTKIESGVVGARQEEANMQ